VRTIRAITKVEDEADDWITTGLNVASNPETVA
jgi:hypothetical protein